MQLSIQYSIGNFTIRWNWLIAGCVVITSLGLGRLGIWQLDRAAEKIEAQQALLEEQEANATPIEDIPSGHLHRTNPELANRHVALDGEYENQHTILLMAEFFDSQIGYGVVTPFRLRSNKQLILVHRGWTSGILPPNTPPSTHPVDGLVTVNAQIFIPPENTRVLSSKIDALAWPLQMRSLEIDVISAILGEPVFPFAVRLTDDQPGVLVRHWPAVQIDVNQHLFYALQWFLFASIMALASLFASSNLWQLLKGKDPSIPDIIQPNQ